MREAINKKTILASAAIAIFALMVIPMPAAFASVGSNSCNTFNLSLSNYMTNPSSQDMIPYTLQLSGVASVQKGALTQGALSGTFDGNAVQGGYSFNTATGKLLAKVVGAGYEIDLAFVTSGAPAGFTFIGTYHVVGQAPLMLLGPLGASAYCS
ncbi:MAG TPA: hypothetical protein VJR06_09170 [Nitrososphaerales archaeon]|nr:hypothetical protein [Nitrososphaerales archaeon]